ncbi:glycoside hydrolase family 3 C-terminal domain-containing protein [bacterium]|nr:glycoside hydrolase family 3 C-terminal domain-containing protein [bacterium]
MHNKKRQTRQVIPIMCFLFTAAITAGSGPAEKNTDPDIEAKIRAMTLEEKIDFIGGYRGFNIRGYDHLGIPEIRFADGPVGVRNYGKSTAYPASITLAASWDKKLAYDIGKAIGSEARAKNVHVVLGPAMNIYRMPLCGRNFEYLGEDPYLAGQMAAAYTRGMQDQGVVACAKHYVANNQEFNRHHCSSDMDERTLHEIYLPAFRITVQEGRVGTVMTSYNLINGIHASEHAYLITDVLKNKWGFDGFVMSDWVSTYDGPACARAGLDLEMPSGKLMNRESLMPLIREGKLEERIIDDKIRRILSVYRRFGFFDHPDIGRDYTLDEAAVRETAIRAAREGMVLLKNETGMLPLDRSKIKSIAVIGPNGHPAVTGGGGSSRVDPLHPLSLSEAVQKIAGEHIEVVFQKGIFTGMEMPEGIFDDFDFYVYQDGIKKTGAHADFYVGKKLEGDIVCSRFFGRLDLADGDMWDIPGVPETDFSARFHCFYTPGSSGYYAIAGRGDDGYIIRLDGKEIVRMWRDQGPAAAKYDVYLEAGREYRIEVDYYQSGGGAVIQLGAKKAGTYIGPEQYPELAAEAAKKADLVILAAGFNSSSESEGFDRTVELPDHQAEFINRIADVNPNVIVVLNAGGNVEMESWIGRVKALLMAWYPGQEGNLAAAEILFGDINPSGKLPASFEKSIEDNPCYAHYFDQDQDLRVFYGEGIFMGYRYWDRSETRPRFPFGFGLSYTSFGYAGIYTDRTDYTKEDSVSVSVRIKNTGDRAGSEIVQVYVADEACSLPRPVKELKAFEKVRLGPDEEKTVRFTLGREAFSFYDPECHDWRIEPGTFDILIGSSSEDIRQKAVISIQ